MFWPLLVWVSVGTKDSDFIAPGVFLKAISYLLWLVKRLSDLSEGRCCAVWCLSNRISKGSGNGMEASALTWSSAHVKAEEHKESRNQSRSLAQVESCGQRLHSCQSTMLQMVINVLLTRRVKMISILLWSLPKSQNASEIWHTHHFACLSLCSDGERVISSLDFVPVCQHPSKRVEINQTPLKAQRSAQQICIETLADSFEEKWGVQD